MRVLKLLLAALSAVLLSGCMALPFVPMVYGMTDKPTSDRYTSSTARPQVFNAALKALQAKGTVVTTDRETGSIKGGVTAGATPYAVTIFIDEKGGKTTLQLDVKNNGVGGKFDFKTTGEIGKEVLEEIERQLGSRLEKT